MQLRLLWLVLSGLQLLEKCLVSFVCLLIRETDRLQIYAHLSVSEIFFHKFFQGKMSGGLSEVSGSPCNDYWAKRVGVIKRVENTRTSANVKGVYEVAVFFVTSV